MDKEKLRILFNEIRYRVDLAESILDQEDTPTIKAGENLQSYLDKGGEYSLEPGSSFEAQAFTFRKPIILHGNNAFLHLTAAPLRSLPGVNDIFYSDLTVDSQFPVVIQHGDNDSNTQGRLEDIPQRIHLQRISVPFHRGKRALELNCGNVIVEDCVFLDLFDPSLRDSQSICILNSDGNILVRGGTFTAASENILIGGDTNKVPGLVTQNVTFDGVTLLKPLAWRTDGVKKSIKNSFELKKGRNVTFRNSVIDGCWKDGQDGFAFMITPSNGNFVEDVLIENVQVKNVSSIINLTGYDATGINQTRTKGITLKSLIGRTNAKEFGGRGCFVLANSIHDLTIQNCETLIDGTSLVYQTGAALDYFEYTGSKSNVGKYGLFFAGGANGSLMGQGALQYLVERNTFAEAAPLFQKNFPLNTYISLMDYVQEFGNL